MYELSQKETNELVKALSDDVIEQEESDYARIILRKALVEQERIFAELKFDLEETERKIKDISNVLEVLKSKTAQ